VKKLRWGLERAKGFEPSPTDSEASQNHLVTQSSREGYTHGYAQISGASCPDLAKVVTAWAKLPAALKAAILAIVGSLDSFPEAKP
jgi:hypothetical protein